MRVVESSMEWELPLVLGVSCSHSWEDRVLRKGFFQLTPCVFDNPKRWSAK